MASRGVQFLVLLSAIFGMWLALILKFSKQSTGYVKYAIYGFPIILGFLFGCYSGFSVIYNMIIFRTCPQKAEDLKKDVQEAKDFYASRGVRFD
ncbi:hypothetical protein PAPYR_12453 [Paratrimastix pyriformis]|uniref:Dolichol-phosphate mannosyltransferase subunit 3 n=1 Tax=Paratrimastix pyriformis TaxID=342808 RepID=A0ABQ8U3H1_9EUKA|nr:hypothetical protein PAPYR_12453 [Paratrimastix pyriformis]